jgi:cytochrome P450
MFNTNDLSVQKNPYPFFAWLRSEHPVYQDPATGVYFVTQDADIRQVAMDSQNFSSVIDPSVFRVVMGKQLEQSDPEVADLLKTNGWLLPTTLLLIDPPEHTRYRRLAQEALSPRAVQQLLDAVRGRIDELLNEFPADGHVEFVNDFAKRLPLWVICRFIFGADESDFQQINDWADQFFLTLMPAAPREEYMVTVQTMIRMHHYIKDKIDHFRATPDDNILLSRLINVHLTTGDTPLADEELISIMTVMLLAGHDTTRQSLGNALLELSRHPELGAQMRSDSSKILPFIHEVLRLNPPANVTPRITAADVEVHGTLIPKGSMVFVAWGSANRDHHVFPNPDNFDITRPNGKHHLSFGWGLHHCVGAHLARAQVTLTLEAILQRFSSVSLAIDDSELDYAPSMNTRSLERLPLIFR